MSKPISRKNRFASLARVLLASSLNLSAFRARSRRSRVEYLKSFGILAVIAAGLTPTLLLYSQLLWRGYDLLAPVGQSGAILTLGIVVVSSMIFFFGIFYVLNTFYFAKDVEALLPLPLRGWEVLGARFTVVLFFEYITALPFLLPPLLIFGIKSGAPLIYWLYGVLGYLLVPLAPLALASLLSMVLMRFTNLSRRKDLFKILGSIFVIALAIGIQFLFQKAGPNVTDPQYLQDLLSNPEGLTVLISRAFPSTRFFSLALIYSTTVTGLTNLLYFAGVSLLSVAFTWLLAERLYFPGIIGSSETSARRRVFNRAQYEKLVRSSSPTISYFKKEIRVLLRTPIYMINCVLPIFLVPVVLIIPLVLQSKNQPGPMPWENLSQDPRASVILLVVLSGISLFLSVTDSITPTSLSREGGQFYVSKYIPLPYQKQILSKLLSGFLFGTLGSLLIILAAGLFFRLAVYMVAIILAVTLVAIVPLIEIGLLLDIYRPKLDWDNEQTAVKRNLNIVFAMLASILVGGGVALAVINFFSSLLAASLFMLTVYGLLAVAFYWVLMTWGVARYQKLEG